jgi:hypothetical protein
MDPPLVLRHRMAMGDERSDVLLDRISHVARRLFDRAPVAEAAGQAWPGL